MRILFLAPRHPHPPDRGDQRRVLHLLEELSRAAEVTLLTFGEGEPPCPGVRVVGVGRRTLALLAGNLRRPDPRLPVQTRLYLNAEMFRAVADEVRRDPPDVLHATLARMAPYLLPGPWHRHLDLVDSLSLNMAARARASRGPAKPVFALEAALMRRYEAACVARVESSSLVAESDRLAPGLASAAVVPNGVDVRSFPFVEPRERPAVLVFFGNLGYFHNLEAARFVAQDVLPRVRRELPHATLRLVGARPAAAVRRLARIDGVHVVGPVPEMAAELHEAAVAVIPSFSGSGMKNKVLEAFAVGTPVVSNALGIYGIDGARAGHHYIQAETAEALASACAELISDPRRRVELARAGRALVEGDYTWTAQAQRLLALYAGAPARA